ADPRGRGRHRPGPGAGAEDRQGERLGSLHEPLHGAVAARAVVHDVELAGFVLAERGDRERGVHELSARPRLAALRGRPDPARAEVAVEEPAGVLRKAAAAIAI